jgi:hypothetical protein
MITVGPVARPRHPSCENAALSHPVKPPWKPKIQHEDLS